MKIVGVLMAGGLSLRMGADKASLELNGESFLTRLISMLADVHTVNEIVISSNYHGVNGIKSVKDQFGVVGPLGGIASVFEEVSADYYLFVSCDTPLVTSQAVRQLVNKSIDENKSIVAKCNDRIHPLIACYKKTDLELASSQIEAKKYALMKFLKLISYEELELDAQEVLNVNTPQDYFELKQKISK